MLQLRLPANYELRLTGLMSAGKAALKGFTNFSPRDATAQHTWENGTNRRCSSRSSPRHVDDG